MKKFIKQYWGVTVLVAVLVIGAAAPTIYIPRQSGTGNANTFTNATLEKSVTLNNVTGTRLAVLNSAKQLTNGLADAGTAAYSNAVAFVGSASGIGTNTTLKRPTIDTNTFSIDGSQIYGSLNPDGIHFARGGVELFFMSDEYDATHSFSPITDNNADLGINDPGTATNRWRTLWLSGSLMDDGSASIGAGLKLLSATPNRAAYFAAGSQLTNSPVTDIELALLSGQTSLAYQPTNSNLTTLAAVASTIPTNWNPNQFSGPTLTASNGITLTNAQSFSQTNRPQASNQVAATFLTKTGQNTNIIEIVGSNALASSAFSASGGLHIGGLTQVGGSNLTVEGTVQIGASSGGVNSGLSITPGAFLVTIQGSSGNSFNIRAPDSTHFLVMQDSAGHNNVKIGPAVGVVVNDYLIITNRNSTIGAQVGGTASSQTSPVSNTGTAQTNLLTYSLPASALTNNGDRIFFRASGRLVANADAKELLVTFGSETIFDSTSQIVNVANEAWIIKGEIIRTGNTAQTAWAELTVSGTSLFTTTSAVTLAQTNGIATTLAIAAVAGASNDVTNRTLVVEYFPSP